jgi:hypothetical protein
VTLVRSLGHLAGPDCEAQVHQALILSTSIKEILLCFRHKVRLCRRVEFLRPVREAISSGSTGLSLTKLRVTLTVVGFRGPVFA